MPTHLIEDAGLLRGPRHRDLDGAPRPSGWLPAHHRAAAALDADVEAGELDESRLLPSAEKRARDVGKKLDRLRVPTRFV